MSLISFASSTTLNNYELYVRFLRCFYSAFRITMVLFDFSWEESFNAVVESRNVFYPK